LNHNRPPTPRKSSELLANWGILCCEGARALGQCSLAILVSL
jgi:hypothetical protein